MVIPVRFPPFPSFSTPPRSNSHTSWLTAFIFAAQDYNRADCRLNAPYGRGCSLKFALEAFIFLAFFFTMAALAADVFNFRDDTDDTTHMEKNVRHSDATGGTAA